MPAKVIEADLLFGCVGGRWAGRLFLQGAMHALVPPILLRRSGKDEVRFDAELEPPGRQPGQPPRTGRPERCSIIAADRKRQPVGSKGRREGRLNTLDRRLRDPNVKQKAAMAVGQRQGIDLALIGGTEPALEVGRPLVVGSRHTRKWASLINRSAPALHRRNQPGLLENVADRGGSRPTHLGSSAAEYHQQLTPPSPLRGEGVKRRAHLTLQAQAQ